MQVTTKDKQFAEKLVANGTQLVDKKKEETNGRRTKKDN